MAQFMAEIQGNRGYVSRLGSRESGIWAHVHGWNVGVRVIGIVDETGEDVFMVYATSGSNGGKNDVLVAKVMREDLDAR